MKTVIRSLKPSGAAISSADTRAFPTRIYSWRPAVTRSLIRHLLNLLVAQWAGANPFGDPDGNQTI